MNHAAVRAFALDDVHAIGVSERQRVPKAAHRRGFEPRTKQQFPGSIRYLLRVHDLRRAHSDNAKSLFFKGSVPNLLLCTTAVQFSADRSCVLKASSRRNDSQSPITPFSATTVMWRPIETLCDNLLFGMQVGKLSNPHQFACTRDKHQAS